MIIYKDEFIDKFKNMFEFIQKKISITQGNSLAHAEHAAKKELSSLLHDIQANYLIIYELNSENNTNQSINFLARLLSQTNFPNRVHDTDLVPLKTNRISLNVFGTSTESKNFTLMFPAIKTNLLKSKRQPPDSKQQHLLGYIDMKTHINLKNCPIDLRKMAFENLVLYAKNLLFALENSAPEYHTTTLILTGSLSSTLLATIRQLEMYDYIPHVSVVYALPIQQNPSQWVTFRIKGAVSHSRLKISSSPNSVVSKKSNHFSFTDESHKEWKWKDFKSYFIMDEFVIEFERQAVEKYSPSLNLSNETETARQTLDSYVKGLSKSFPGETQKRCFSLLEAVKELTPTGRDALFSCEEFQTEKFTEFLKNKIPKIISQGRLKSYESKEFIDLNDKIQILFFSSYEKFDQNSLQQRREIAAKALIMMKRNHTEMQVGEINPIYRLSWDHFLHDVRRSKFYCKYVTNISYQEDGSDLNGPAIPKNLNVFSDRNDIQIRYNLKSIDEIFLENGANFPEEDIIYTIQQSSHEENKGSHTLHGSKYIVTKRQFPSGFKCAPSFKEKPREEQKTYIYLTSLSLLAAKFLFVNHESHQFISVESLCRRICESIEEITISGITYFKRWQKFFKDEYLISYEEKTLKNFYCKNIFDHIVKYEYKSKRERNPDPAPNLAAINEKLLSLGLWSEGGVTLRRIYEFFGTYADHDCLNQKQISEWNDLWKKKKNDDPVTLALIRPHPSPKKICKLIYAITLDGEVWVNYERYPEKSGERPTHSELTFGLPVQAAGELLFEYAKRGDIASWMLKEINNGSGHYRPTAFESLPLAKRIILEQLYCSEKFPHINQKACEMHALPQLRHCLRPGAPGDS